MEDTQNNTLGQLNIELFAQLHRLREVDVSDEAALRAEIERSRQRQGNHGCHEDEVNVLAADHGAEDA